MGIQKNIFDFISYLFIITSILSMYFFEINYCYRLFMKITYISIFIFLGIMMKIVNKENLKKFSVNNE